MKKILLLLLLATFSIQAQTLQNPTYGNVKLKNNTTDNSATKVNVQSTDGTINTISKSDLVNVVEVNDVPSLPLVGKVGKIYVVKNVNKIYRWNGTFYQELATDISGKEDIANKQNSLAVDGTGVKFPTVDATNAGLANKLNLINAKQFGALADGTTNDTTILQAYLDSGQGTYIFPKGNYSISGLDVNSNSTLIFEEGSILFLIASSNRPVLQNKNFVGSTNIDKNIIINGLEIDGNEANQAKFGTVSPYLLEPTAGIRFFGVENLTIKNTKINKAKNYGIWICRARNVIVDNVEFNQSLNTISNQDGLHFAGLSYNLKISNIRGVTNDDMVALCTDDVPQGGNFSNGDIINATIENIVFENNLNGIRLLSAVNRLDKITVSNLSGIVRDNVVAVSAYQLGEGNIGSITIDNVKVDTTVPHGYLGEYGGYILVNDKVDYLKISNIYRLTGSDPRPTVRVQSRANISKLIIDNSTTIINRSLTTYLPDISFENGSKLNQVFLSNLKLLNGEFPNGFHIGATGSIITRLHLNNIYAEQIGYGLYLNNTDVVTLFLNATDTNYIRFPFYLVNDSDIGLAVIDNQKWAYTEGEPKVYNILDTSSIVFASGETANTVVKWDENFIISPTPLKDIDGELRSVNNNNGYALNLFKTGGFGSALALRSTSGSSDSLLRMFKTDNVTFTDLYATVSGIGFSGTVTSTQYKLSALNTAPASATATGTTGEIRITSGFIYICIATNTWVRAAFTTWI